MRTEYLGYVLDTAELGSIALAAKKNFISPQGLGRAVSVVEDELGFSIFDRGGGGITLTQKGASILPAITRLVRSSCSLREEALKLTDGDAQSQAIIFCSSIVFMSGLISRLYANFLDSPYDLHYVQMSTDKIIGTFCDGLSRYGDLSNSCGIVLHIDSNSESAHASVSRMTSHGCVYRPYIEYEDGVLLPTSSPLAQKDSVKLSDLAGMPVISSHAEQLPVLERTFGHSAVSMVVPDASFRKQLVRDGRGITFYPAFLGEEHAVEGTRFVALQDSWRIRMGFVAMPSFYEQALAQDIYASLNAFYEPIAQSGLCKIL